MYRTILLAAAIALPLSHIARAEGEQSLAPILVQATCVASITACPNAGNTANRKCVRDSGSGSAGHWWNHQNCDSDPALEWLRLDTTCTCSS